MNKLQIGVIIAAVVLLGIVLGILTGIIPGLKDNSGTSGDVVMWGFDDQKVFDGPIRAYGQANPKVGIKYFKKSPSNFESEFLNAIARGESPDIVVFPSDFLAKHKDKLSAAPSIMITEKEISQQYIESAQAFIGPKGEIMGIPFTADALVLYFNQDIFTQNFITLPPTTWNEFLTDAAKLTKKDISGNILVSGAALGRASNIQNAPLILTALFLQSGEKIIDENGLVVLGDLPPGSNAQVRPSESALRFFSDFANPAKSAQSWSAALPEARDLFTSGKLAMYIGVGQDLAIIQSQNPHLNFSLAPLPQLSGDARSITSGVLYALSVPKASRNQILSWTLIKFLTGANISADYASARGAASPRRDVLATYGGDSIKSVLAQSMLALKIWPIPDPRETDIIFQTLIEDTALGRGTMRNAIDKARARLNQI